MSMPEASWEDLLQSRRFGHAIAAAVAIATFALTWDKRNLMHPDWIIAKKASETLLSSDYLSLYVNNPRAQMGPLAILLSRVPHLLYLTLVSACAGVFVIWAIEASGKTPARRRGWIARLACVTMLPLPWSQLAWKGHVDDALVLLGAVWLLKEYHRGSSWRRLPGYLVAVAGKPTAFLLLPLVLSTVPLAVSALSATVILWAPFMVEDLRAMLAASKGVMTVGGGSLPALLGAKVGSSPAAWIRLTQLGGGTILVLLGAWRKRPAEAVLLAFALRALVDPNPAPAYSISLVALSFIIDWLRSSVVLTGVSFLSFWISQDVLDGASGWPRIATLLALVALITGHLGVRSMGGNVSPSDPSLQASY